MQMLRDNNFIPLSPVTRPVPRTVLNRRLCLRACVCLWVGEKKKNGGKKGRKGRDEEEEERKDDEWYHRVDRVPRKAREMRK